MKKLDKTIYIKLSADDDFSGASNEFLLSNDTFYFRYSDYETQSSAFSDKSIEMKIPNDDPVYQFCLDKIYEIVTDLNNSINAGGYETGSGQVATIVLDEMDIIKKNKKDYHFKFKESYKVKMSFIRPYLTYIIKTLDPCIKRGLAKYYLENENDSIKTVNDEFQNFSNGTSNNLDVKFVYTQRGVYPQRMIHDQTLIERLNKEAGICDGKNPKWIDFGFRSHAYDVPFFFYCDLEVEGKNYRGVYFLDGISCEFDSRVNDYKLTPQGINCFKPNTYYWFIYEPVIWKVFDTKNGHLLFSDLVLDTSDFSRKIEGNKPIYSIYDFLDKNMEPIMFNFEDRNNFIKTPYENIDRSGNLFIPDSITLSKYLNKKDLRKNIPTEYALIKGYLCDFCKMENTYPFVWLNDSIGKLMNRVSSVSEDGSLIDFYAENFGYIYYSIGGVKPCLRVKSIEEVNKPEQFLNDVEDRFVKRKTSSIDEDQPIFVSDTLSF